MRRHLFLRILLVIVFPIIGGFVGSIVSANAQCGTGAMLGVVLMGVLFLVLSMLILFIESYFLNRKREIKKRNINLILAIPLLILIIYFLSLFIY